MINKEFLLIVLKRFVKGFVAGGLSSVIIVMQTKPLELTENYAVILVTAFLTGGLLMIEKSLQGYNP